MLTPPRNRLKSKRGQILVLFPFLMFLLLGFFAVAYNTGVIGVKRMELQKAADAAALSGARIQSLNLEFVAITNDIMNEYIADINEIIDPLLPLIPYSHSKNALSSFLQGLTFGLSFGLTDVFGATDVIDQLLGNVTTITDVANKLNNALAPAVPLINTVTGIGEQQAAMVQSVPDQIQWVVKQVAQQNGADDAVAYDDGLDLNLDYIFPSQHWPLSVRGSETKRCIENTVIFGCAKYRYTDAIIPTYSPTENYLAIRKDLKAGSELSVKERVVVVATYDEGGDSFFDELVRSGGDTGFPLLAAIGAARPYWSLGADPRDDRYGGGSDDEQEQQAFLSTFLPGPWWQEKLTDISSDLANLGLPDIPARNQLESWVKTLFLTTATTPSQETVESRIKNAVQEVRFLQTPP